MLAQAVYAIFYGDMLMLLNNQVRSREIHAGDSQRMLETWTRRIAEECRTPRFATRFQKKPARHGAGFRRHSGDG